MSVISGSVSSLANGVSQQPAWARLPSQGTEQVNALSSLVDGLARRPGTRHVSRISTGAFAAAHYHTIVRDASERYEVVITNGNLRVFAHDGSEKTVAFPNGKAYLNATDPTTAFTALTITDLTFVLNKTKVTTKTTQAYTRPNDGFVYIKQAINNANYTVYIDGVNRATTLTSATGTVQTDQIATTLASALTSSLGAGWTITTLGSTIRIRRTASTPFSVQTLDSFGDTASVGWYDSIQSFSDLPIKIWDLTQVKITNTAGNEFDEYYVTFNAAKQVWEEDVCATEEERPTPSTMPHKLTREIDGTFTFAEIDYGWRVAGDNESAETPSFVGKPLDDIVFHKNRLAFLAGENLVMSRVSRDGYFEFYPSTVTAALDTAPIDIAVTGTKGNSKVASLKYALPFNGDLVLFAEPLQFTLKSGETLTSGTISATQTTEFEADLLAKPAPAGRNIYFATSSGAYAGLREYMIDPEALTPDAVDATIHIPKYIPGRIKKLATATNEDIMFCLTTGPANRMYVYKYFYEGSKKLQASWSYWEFPAGEKVLNVTADGSSVYLTIERDTGVFIEVMPIGEDLNDAGLDFTVALDRKTTVTGVYDAVNNRTTWTLPYVAASWVPILVLGSGFPGAGLEVPSVTQTSSTTLRAPGNWSAGPCLIGRRFKTSYVFSDFTVGTAGADGRGRTAITDGRLQIRHLWINHGDSGFFTVKVQPGRGRNEFSYSFRLSNLQGGFSIGRANLQSGRFRVPVGGKNTDTVITLESESHLPCSILSADWEAEWFMRSRRV